MFEIPAFGRRCAACGLVSRCRRLARSSSGSAACGSAASRPRQARRLGTLTQRGVGVHAEHEVDAARPTGRSVSVNEKSVSPRRQHPLGSAGPPGRSPCRSTAAAPAWLGRVAGAVDQIQHLLGVGQRDDQRRVAPDPLVARCPCPPCAPPVGAVRSCRRCRGRRPGRAAQRPDRPTASGAPR